MKTMHLEAKKTKLIHQHRFSLFFFAFLVIYQAFIVRRFQFEPMNDLVYSYYCVDFSFGFGTKLLPGAIFNTLFGAHANRVTATVFAGILLLAAFAGISVLAEKFLEKMPMKYRSATFLLLLFFISGAYTFAIFGKWLGLLETYWMLSAVLFLIFLDHKLLRFFIPLIYAFVLLIHFSAMVFIVPVFSILLLYRLAVEPEQKQKRAYGIVFAVSVCLAIAFFTIMVANEAHWVLPMEEFHQKLAQKGVTNTSYFDYSFFYIWNGESMLPSFVTQIQSPLLRAWYTFYYIMKENYKLSAMNPKYAVVTSVCGFVMLLPLLIAFYRVFIASLKKKGNALKQFCAFLMVVQFPFVMGVGLLFATSVDMTRYFTFAFLGSFLCLLTILRFDIEQRELFLERFARWQNTIGMKIYLLSYLFFVLAPCY